LVECDKIEENHCIGGSMRQFQPRAERTGERVTGSYVHRPKANAAKVGSMQERGEGFGEIAFKTGFTLEKASARHRPE
jgi:hypothetical protein